MMRGLSRFQIPATRYSVGVGYVVVPQDVEREEFVTRCYRTNTIAMYTEETEFLLDVPIHPTLIQHIDFPQDGETLGSMVTWVNMPVHNKPIVVALLPKNDDASNLLEHFYKIEKSTDDAMSSIVGRGDKGSLDINVRGVDSDQSQVNIRVINERDQGKFNVEVDGDASILVDKTVTIDAGDKIELIVSDAAEESKTTITYQKGEGLLYVDEFDNEWKINSDGIFLDSQLVQISQGSDFGVLYNKLVAELQKVERKADTALNAIQQGQTFPNDGGSTYKTTMVAIITASLLQDADYTAFKSEKLKLD